MSPSLNQIVITVDIVSDPQPTTFAANALGFVASGSTMEQAVSNLIALMGSVHAGMAGIPNSMLTLNGQEFRNTDLG